MKLKNYRIGDVCSVVKGTYPTQKTPPGMYPLVVTAENRRTAESYQFDTKAVCVPIVSSTGHGHAAINRIHYQEGKFALANIMAAIIPDERFCIAKYLYYLLSIKKDEYLVTLMQGSANVTIDYRRIQDLILPIPDLDDQGKIVSILDKMQKIKHLRKTTIKLGNKLIENIFVRIFGNPQKNEKCWDEATLGDILTEKPTNGFFKKNEFYGKGVPIVWVESLFDRYVLELNGLRLIDANQKETDKFKLDRGDILLCRSSVSTEGIGKMVVVEDLFGPTLFESHIIKLKVNSSKVLPYFVVGYYNSTPGRNLILEKARVSTMTTINQQDVSSLKIFIPKMNLQIKFVEYLGKTLPMLDAQLRSMELMITTFDSINQRIFNAPLVE